MADRVYPETSYRKTKQGPGGASNGAYYSVNDQPKGQPSFLARPPPGAPPPAFYNDRYNGRPRRRNPCCVCLAWFFVTLVVIMVVLGIAALIFWLVVRPKAPKYDVQDVRLKSFSINPTGSVSSGLFQLSAVTSYTVLARNPNKKIAIYYDTINISVLSEGATIGHGNVAPFYQGHKSSTTVAGDLNSTDLPLASTVGNALQSARNSGKVPLFVSVDVRARIKIGRWKSPHFWVHVRCNVNVNPTISTGSQVINKNCRVKRKGEGPEAYDN